jgi:hypothetical protein
MKSLAMDLLARVRAKVDRVIFFGLGLKVKATRAIRRRLGRVISRMGLKPKLLFGSKLRGRRRPRLPKGFECWCRLGSRFKFGFGSTKGGDVTGEDASGARVDSEIQRGLSREGML